ncbi:hypothetical protein Bca4012_020507 [Brassica carinata]
MISHLLLLLTFAIQTIRVIATSIAQPIFHLLRFWEARNLRRGGEQVGRCSNKLEVRLHRFWEPRMEESLWADMLFLDEKVKPV